MTPDTAALQPAQAAGSATTLLWAWMNEEAEQPWAASGLWATAGTQGGTCAGTGPQTRIHRIATDDSSTSRWVLGVSPPLRTGAVPGNQRNMDRKPGAQVRPSSRTRRPRECAQLSRMPQAQCAPQHWLECQGGSISGCPNLTEPLRTCSDTGGFPFVSAGRSVTTVSSRNRPASSRP